MSGFTNTGTLRSPPMPEISTGSVSESWVEAVKLANKQGNKEVANLIVSVTGLRSNKTLGNSRLRALHDAALERDGKHTTGTVSNTIFPSSLWDKSKNRSSLYERYLRLWPRISEKAQNRRGTYFQRLISYPRPGEVPLNQLEHVIEAYKNGIRRRSTFQCGILVPHLDLNPTPYQGFPCMQQVAFLPTSRGTLRVCGFYPMQYLWARAYGNYLGLIEVGRFMAHEMGLSLVEMTCITLIAKLDNPPAAMKIVGGSK
jgi:hypothetical protein